MDSIQRNKSEVKCAKVNWKSTITVVFISLLLDLLCFTMILPLLPSLLDHYRKHDGSDGLYYSCLKLIGSFRSFVGAPHHFDSVLFGGFLGSLFSFLQFVISPIAGGLSDVYGRKPILLLSLIGISVSYLVWALSYDFRLFVLARIIGGVSKGNVSLVMAIITDVSTNATRAYGMAMVGIAFSLGFIVGPLIGAGFAKWALHSQNQHWFHFPAIFALVISIFNVIFVAFKFDESLPKAKRAKSLVGSVGDAVSFINVISLLRFQPVTNLSKKDRAELSQLGLIYFVYLFLFSGLEFTLTFMTHHIFNYSAQQQGVMFFFIGLIMALLQGGCVRRIPQHKVASYASLGLLLIIPAFVFIGHAKTEFLLYVGLFLFAVSTSMVVPCTTTLASAYGGAEQKGTVMGVYRSLGALARSMGPIIASTAYWCLGAQITYSIGSVFLIWPWYKLLSSRKQPKSAASIS